MGNKSKRQGGFSLIELMVVIAIVAVLSAVAVPAYKDYIMRSKVVQFVQLAETLKPKIADYYNKGVVFGPGASALAGLTPFPYDLTAAAAGTNRPVGLAQLSVAGYGTIQSEILPSYLGLDDGADRLMIRLYPNSTVSGVLSWTCAYFVAGAGSTAVKYLPTSCQNDSAVVDLTKDLSM